MPATSTTLKLGQDEEDSFAKFVGKFDDEYGGRRGEWTFRAKAPLNPLGGNGDGPRSVWDSPGAGTYDVFANGEVRAEMTGTIWRTSRKGICEYELEYVHGIRHPTSTLPVKSTSDKFVLATKAAHGEAGGTKSPYLANIGSYRQSLEPPRAFANRLRVSISEATRAMRLDSSDSGNTTKMSSSLPAQAPLPKKNRSFSKGEEQDKERLRTDRGQSSSSQSHKLYRLRSRDKDGQTHKEKDKDKDKDKDRDSPRDKEDKKAGFFKRGIIAPFKNSLAQYEGKKAQKEERERERQQAHSWSGVSNNPDWIHPSGKNTPPPMTSPTTATAPTAGRSDSSNTTATASSVRTSISDDHGLKPVFGTSSVEGDSRRGSGSLNWRQGKAWIEVPDDAVAMILDCHTGEPTEESDTISTTMESRTALLVWYVPFNSDADDRERARDRERERTVTATTSNTRSTLGSIDNIPPQSPSSLPKFQKLLRRRASKDKEVIKTSTKSASTDTYDYPTPTTMSKGPRHPLPFRSFRVVARIVDIDDLKSEFDSPFPNTNPNHSLPDRNPSPQPQPRLQSSSIPAPRPAAMSMDSAIPKPRLVTTQTNTTTSSSLSGSTAPTSTILAGRTISTVIAVCHSRSQGVEFVLEGLDRLGYCVGESAWGPTGYEEWRGTGLSERGRELLDLLWAGCTAVMGLAG
jgi:hypothetical protein